MHKSKTDLRFNVAQLLREEVGSQRTYTFAEDRLALDDEMSLTQLTGSVRFTRTVSGVLGDVRASGTVEMACIRCLKPSAQEVSVAFCDEFHSRIEVNTGVPLPTPDEEDPFYINELHLVDLEQALREYVLLALPMQPLCKADCKGLCSHCGIDLNLETCNCGEPEEDERFAALRSLLDR